jgi:hypothetical protein
MRTETEDPSQTRGVIQLSPKLWLGSLKLLENLSNCLRILGIVFSDELRLCLLEIGYCG